MQKDLMQFITKEHFNEFDLSHLPPDFYSKVIQFIKNEQQEAEQKKLKIQLQTLLRIRLNKIISQIKSDIKLEDIQGRLTNEEKVLYANIQSNFDDFFHNVSF